MLRFLKMYFGKREMKKPERPSNRWMLQAAGHEWTALDVQKMREAGIFVDMERIDSDSLLPIITTLSIEEVQDIVGKPFTYLTYEYVSC